MDSIHTAHQANQDNKRIPLRVEQYSTAADQAYLVPQRSQAQLAEAESVLDAVSTLLQPSPNKHHWEDGEVVNPAGIPEKALGSLLSSAILGAAHRALGKMPLQYFQDPHPELLLDAADEGEVQAIMGDAVIQMLFDARYDDFWASVPGALDVAMGAVGIIGLPACREVLVQLGAKHFGSEQSLVERIQRNDHMQLGAYYFANRTDWGFCLQVIHGLKLLQKGEPSTEEIGMQLMSAASVLVVSIQQGYTMPLRVLRAVAARSLDDEAGQRTVCRLFTSLQVAIRHKKADEYFLETERHTQIASQLPLRSVAKFVFFSLANGMTDFTEPPPRHTLCSVKARKEYWQSVDKWSLCRRYEIECMSGVGLYDATDRTPRPKYNMVRQAARVKCSMWCNIPLDRYTRSGPKDVGVDWSERGPYELLRIAFVVRCLARDILLPDSSSHVSLTAPYVKRWYFDGASDLCRIAHKVLIKPVRDLVRSARWSGAASDFNGYGTLPHSNMGEPRRPDHRLWERNATWVRMARPRRDMLLSRARAQYARARVAAKAAAVAAAAAAAAAAPVAAAAGTATVVVAAEQ